MQIPTKEIVRLEVEQGLVNCAIAQKPVRGRLEFVGEFINPTNSGRPQIKEIIV